MRAQASKRRGLHLSFWQKTYLLTFTLFLVCLNGGIFAITSISQNQSYTAECEKALTQQHYLMQSLASDIAAVRPSREHALPALYRSYGEQYSRRGVNIAVLQNGNPLYDGLPKMEGSLPTAPNANERSYLVRTAQNGERYLYVTSVMPEPYADTALVCAFLIEGFFVNWSALLRGFQIAGVSISALLGFVLFFVMRGLSRPLTRLTDTAGRLADGDYDARATERGTDEIAQLAHALNNMAKKVQQNMASLSHSAEQKQNLVDNLSHEMRTPLTAIGGYAEYMQRAELAEAERYEATQYIVSETRRLQAMSECLLQMAALRGEKAVMSQVPVRELLTTVARTVFPKAAARSVHIRIAPSDDCIVLGEQALLESLFVNLVDNAVKASSKGQKVVLCAREINQTIEIMVNDNGHGMNSETLSRMGEAFFRADKARSRAEGGAGLGLALCSQIVESHGAKISFASRENEGTAVRVTFPMPTK